MCDGPQLPSHPHFISFLDFFDIFPTTVIYWKPSGASALLASATTNRQQKLEITPITNRLTERIFLVLVQFELQFLRTWLQGRAVPAAMGQGGSCPNPNPSAQTWTLTLTAVAKLPSESDFNCCVGSPH